MVQLLLLKGKKLVQILRLFYRAVLVHLLLGVMNFLFIFIFIVELGLI